MTRQQTTRVFVVAILVASGASAAFAQSEPPEDPKQAPPSPPPTVQVRATPFEGSQEDAAYARSIAARATELVAQADESADPRVRADLLLAAANLILAHELEPACTEKLLGLQAGQAAMSAKQITDALDRADGVLAKAGEILDDASAFPEDAADWAADRRDRLDTLTAFSHGLRAYLVPDEGPDGAKSARHAASGLSVLLEHGNPQVVAAATLWQACLRANESDASRAMFVLDLALSEPRRRDMPFAFFSRLLRCQLLASRGSYAVSLALLTQIEDLCDIWFIRDAERADALRATTFVKIQILRDWHAHMPETPESAERQWCLDRIQKLTEDRFPEDQRTLLRLSTAVPIIASPEDAGRHNPGAETNGE